MRPGQWNAITDVPGVRVGHVTLRKADSVRTGVTAILPHAGNIFQEKVPAAVFTGNGFGKLAGVTQLQELGSLESPVILTNTLSVADGIRGVLDHTLAQPGNEKVQSVNAVVGETNDGRLNDIRGRHVKPTHVVEAIRLATSGPVAQGCVGAGTGTVCFGYKGGIGTSSRKLPAALGGYTVGVLVQANFGGVLQIEGVPVGELLGNHYLRDQLKEKEDGSCMIVVATDAPIDARNLQRLAKRAFMGLARTGGIAHHGSGDYVIAFSTDSASHIPHQPAGPVRSVPLLHDDHVSPLFLAAIEATEEAILNALFTAETTTGKGGARVESLPVNRVLELLKK
jgi:D-aminopeptidase